MMLKYTMLIIGKRLVTTNGEEWALHCRVVNPAFHHEKLEVQTKTTLQMPLTNLLKKYFKIIMN
jgi:cytochrome P450